MLKPDNVVFLPLSFFFRHELSFLLNKTSSLLPFSDDVGLLLLCICQYRFYPFLSKLLRLDFKQALLLTELIPESVFYLPHLDIVFNLENSSQFIFFALEIFLEFLSFLGQLLKKFLFNFGFENRVFLQILVVAVARSGTERLTAP